MANTENLMTPQELNARLTPEERSANASKAGIASGEARNLKSMLLKAMRNGGYEEMTEVAMREMKAGNAKFWELIRDTIGEKPTESVSVNANVQNPFSGFSTDELKQMIDND